MAAWVHFIIVGAIFWAVICRARHMSADTSAVVRWQHGLLNAAALMSLVVDPEWRAGVLACGVFAFLLLGSARWRHGAPVGTKAPVPPPAVDRSPWLPEKG